MACGVSSSAVNVAPMKGQGHRLTIRRGPIGQQLQTAKEVVWLQLGATYLAEWPVVLRSLVLRVTTEGRR